MSIIDELSQLQELDELEKEAGVGDILKRLISRGVKPSAAPTRNVERARELPFSFNRSGQPRQYLGVKPKDFKGETLESRRAYVEATNPSRATVKDPMPEPARVPNKPIGHEGQTNTTTQNTDSTTQAPETDTPTKWYKDKKIMKGVGIGAVGAGAVGLGAHMLSQKGQSQDSGTAQGYY